MRMTAGKGAAAASQLPRRHLLVAALGWLSFRVSDTRGCLYVSLPHVSVHVSLTQACLDVSLTHWVCLLVSLTHGLSVDHDDSLAVQGLTSCPGRPGHRFLDSASRSSQPRPLRRPLPPSPHADVRLSACPPYPPRVWLVAVGSHAYKSRV